MTENARAATIQNSRILRGPVGLLDLIGNTSLVHLARIRPTSPDVDIYAKAEWENPGGSVKDRPAMNIIREAETTGLMSRDKTLIDSTSGNTGIAYAMICAAKNYRLKLCMPSNVSMERKRILKAYGAEIVYTDPMEGSDGAKNTVNKKRPINARGLDQCLNIYLASELFCISARRAPNLAALAPPICTISASGVNRFFQPFALKR